MDQPKKGVRYVGLALCVIVASIMILAGAGKAFGTAPANVMEMMGKFGLKDSLPLIGWGAIVSGLLFLLPWTSGLGTLLVSSYWGGAICIHMAHGEKFDLQALFLVVAWLGAYLRGSVPFFWTPTAASSSPSDAGA